MRKKQTTFVCFLIFFILQSHAVCAQELNQPAETLVINKDQDKYILGSNLEILIDSSAELTIQDVTSQAYQDAWFVSEVETPNFGFQTVPYWVRFRVRNESLEDQNWVLAMGFRNTHYIDLYSPEPSGDQFTVSKKGIFSGTETLNNPFDYLSFTLNIPASSEKTYYLRLQSEASMTLSLTLWSPRAYNWHIFVTIMGLGIFFGILLINGLYNAVLFLHLQERPYLYLVLFNAGVIIMFFCYDALIAMFFPVVSPGFAKSLILIAIGTYDFAFIKFIDSFIELRKELPKIHFFANMLSLLFLFLGFTGLILPYNLVAKILLPLGTIVAFLILILNLYLLRRGNRSAKIIIISLVFFLLSAFLINPVRLGYIPSNFITEEAQRLSLVWMALFWSLAMADRMHTLRTEAEKSRQEIEESEQRLTQYLDSMPLGVVVYDADFKLRFINRESQKFLNQLDGDIAFTKITQSSLDKASSLLDFKILNTDTPYPVEKLPITQAIQQRKPAYINDLEVNLGDQKIPLEVWSNPLIGDSGDISGTVVAFQSIQDQLAQEELLRQSEEFRQKILEGSTIGTWMNDLLSGEVIWDSRTMEIYGLSPDVPVNFDLALSLVHPEDRQNAWESFEKAISNQSNGAYEQDLRIIRPDGQERWISSRGNVIYEKINGNNQAVRMVGIVMDITHQKQAEKALEESRIQYQQLVETMNEGLGIVDKNLIFMYANPRLTEMLGYRQEEIIGTHLEAYFNQENFNIVVSQFEKRKKGGEQSYTVTWQCKDGSELHTLVAPAAVFDEKNELLRSIAVVSDISEQVKVNQLLDKRMRERKQEISALMQVSQIIVNPLAFEDQLKNILQRLGSLINYDDASVLLKEENRLISETFQKDVKEDITQKMIQPFMQRDLIDSKFWHGETLIIANIRGGSKVERDFLNLTKQIFGSAPPEMVSWIGVSIKSKNSLIGVLSAHAAQEDFFTQEMAVLMQAFANQIAIIFENERLYKQARTTAAAHERNRIARELHDSVTQALFSVRLYAEATLKTLATGNIPTAKKNLEEVIDVARSGMGNLRLLIFELRPPVLEELGLIEALRKRIETVEKRSAINVNYQTTGRPKLSRDLETQVYWAVYEALSNVIKHAHAHNVILDINFQSNRTQIYLSDDGVGFDPEALKYTGGIGLKNVVERIESFGGIIKIHSRPGEGTVLKIALDH